MQLVCAQRCDQVRASAQAQRQCHDATL
eukprot:COSAG03_NODE_24735_length_270_cov_0.730994_1_plen_27_part_10